MCRKVYLNNNFFLSDNKFEVAVVNEWRNIFETIGSWLYELNVGLELRSGLLSTVWYSRLRVVQKHAITILIKHVDYSPLALPARLPGHKMEHLAVEK